MLEKCWFNMLGSLILNGVFTALVIILGLILSFWVILSDKKSNINKSLFLMINLICLYILSDYLSSLATEPTTTYLLRLAYSLGIITLGTFYYFSLKFPFTKKDNKYVSALLLITVVIFSIITMTTNLIVSSTQFVYWGVRVNEGEAISIYYIFLVLLLILGFSNIITKYSNSTISEKIKIKYLLIGMAIFGVAEIIFLIILPALDIGQYYYFGDYSMIIFCGLAAYAIVKHHLFDVRLAIVRSVTYTLVLVTLAAVYLAIAFVISTIFESGQTSTSQIVSGVAISLLLAFIFQPLKRFFDKITNRVFYKDNYNIGDFFARLNKTLSTTTDLRGLLDRVAYEIGHTLKSEQAFFFIYTDEWHYITAGTSHHKQLPKSDAIELEKVHDGNREVITASLLENDNPTRRLMLSHKIELILPLVKDDKIVGYLCLGDHLTSGYTNRDLKALSTISDELVIAIQNALAVHEIRELNSSLQQKVANATKELRASNLVLRQLDKIKDEFISMASHQLRTPLTSVKGYISMVIEGDAGKISNSQKKLLDEAFMSSERMVHLINDFLNVSRIQTGKFIIDKSPVDLSILVEEEIDSLRPNATARGLKFTYKKPRKFPIIDVDEGKMRQVVMNYADNAIYYSSEGSTIDINLSIDNNEVLFTVIDSGIGVPMNEREHLFSKFYRASNARVRRPDGTGVGIYLAKKVIDAHGGKVVFESVEGKGSTFGFRLPLPSQSPTKTTEPTSINITK